MEISPIGLDIIELRKRQAQHNADIKHIQDSEYLEFKEKCFQIRQKKIRYMKSLRVKEHEYLMVLNHG